ncbi:MAG: sulfatase-like hydrolase/transferase [Rhodobacterales bacterium]|nr:sulfatase-like hydrolase/transferase [Rhodobacterales bacterium]
MIRATFFVFALGCQPLQPVAPNAPTPSPLYTNTGGTTTSVGTYQKPNILLIYTDQHRADALGAAGHPVAITPHLDSLADAGVMFNRMYTSGPVCRPARAAMMTGFYPHQVGVTTNFGEIDPRGVSHVRRIRDEGGYHTAIVGKAHLYTGGGGHAEHFLPRMEEYGWDDAMEQVGPTEQGWRPTAYSDYLESVTEPGARSKWRRFNEYNEAYDFTFPGHDSPPWNIPTEDHADVYAGRTAENWIRERDPTKPFYLQLNFPGPHHPFDATQEYRDLYDPDDPDFPLPVLFEPDMPQSPLIQHLLDIKGVDFQPHEARQLAADYLAGVTLIDDALGGVLDALEETGEVDNTWIVYSSDHGELLADHWLTGKVAFYESSWRVPLIIRPPNGIVPWQSEAFVDTGDMTASLLEMAGLDPEPNAPGTSLVGKVLAGQNAPGADDGRTFVFGANMGNFAVRTDNWKLTYDNVLQNPRGVELYDLVNDPGERDNLIDHPDHAAKVEELTTLLETTMTDHPPIQ